VRRGEHVFVADERRATVEFAVVHEKRHPGVLVLDHWSPADDAHTLARDTARYHNKNHKLVQSLASDHIFTHFSLPSSKSGCSL